MTDKILETKEDVFVAKYQQGYKEGRKEAERMFEQSERQTLRDQFAMAVLPAIISAAISRYGKIHTDATVTAYRVADGMLAARKAGE